MNKMYAAGITIGNENRVTINSAYVDTMIKRYVITVLHFAQLQIDSRDINSTNYLSKMKALCQEHTSVDPYFVQIISCAFPIALEGIIPPELKTLYDSLNGAVLMELGVTSVSYNTNGANSGTVPVESVLYVQGATVMVCANTGNLDKEDYIFVGWNTKVDGNGTILN